MKAYSSSRQAAGSSPAILWRPLVICWAITLCLVASSARPSSALSESDHRKNVRFEHVSLEDGLSQAFVACTLQDRDGFMWFGTQEGLNRYDGYDFKVFSYDPEDPTSLSNNFVKTIYEDRNGLIWVGTDGGGVNRYNPLTESFKSFRHDPDDSTSLSHDRVRAITEDAHGRLWMATDGGGLNRFNRKTETFTSYRHDPDGPETLSHDHIRALLADQDGALWIGMDGSGLSRLEPDTGQFTHFRHTKSNPSSLADDRVRSLMQDRRGRIWIGTYDAGLDLFDPRTGELQHFRHDPEDPTSLASDTIWAVFQDSEGTVWVGTDGGLHEWQTDTRHFHRYQNDPTDPYSLSHNRVASIFEDSGGVLWIGTYGGLSKWNTISEAFLHYRHQKEEPDQLSADFVTAISEGSDGAIWIGTYGGGLNRFDRGSRSFQQLRHDPENANSLSDNRVMSLHLDRQGILWIGTFGGGLNRYDQVSGEFRRYAHDPENPNSLSRNGVTTILEDGSGYLWVGTYRGGLNRLRSDGTGFDRFGHDPDNPQGLSNDRILALHEDSFGDLWIGTDGGGLNRYLPESGTFESIQQDRDNLASLSSNHPWAITEDAEGNLWIGTQGGGVNRWSADDRQAGRERFTRYTKRQGLLSDIIYAVLIDDQGSVWLSSDRGLTQLDPKTGALSHFDASHGLQSNEFNHASAWKAPDGQLFFGGISGFNAFYPRDVHPNLHVPPIVLTQFLKFNQPATLDRPVWQINDLSLTYKDSVVAFEFAALDYSAPHKNLYMYKLEGFDEDWVVPGTLRRATYTNLAAGDYVFRVRASNNDGVWNNEGLSIGVKMVPPPWQSWWAYCLYLLAACCGVIAFSRLQSIRRQRAEDLERANTGLRSEIEERQRKERELEQEKKKAQTYLDVAEVLMVVLDTAGRVTLINQKGARTLGFQESEIIGKNWHDLVVPPRMRDEVIRYLSSPESDEYFEYPVTTSSGDQRIIAWHTTYLTDEEGVLTGTLSSGTDLTQMRRLREAKEMAESANRAKSQFLANMSHEIRTPMNGVLGMVELLLTSELSDQQRQHSETALRSARSLLDVLNDILDFSKIEAGKLELEEVDFDLPELVANACNLFAERAHSKGLNLHCSVSDSVPNLMRGDPTRLSQILANLLGNAVKFTTEGEVGIAVSTTEDSPGEHLVRFEVSDTGVGLEPTVRHRIFESFHQADGSTTRKFGGTGLGLAISKQLVELMSGEIDVESEIGKGSTFWFTIKLAEQQVFTDSSELPISANNSKKILVVNDHASTRDLLAHWLSQWGHPTESANSAWEALSKLRMAASGGQAFDVAIVDQAMPEIDGLQLSQIMNNEPALAGVDVVLLATLPLSSRDKLAKLPNLAVCLSKPTTQIQLRDAIDGLGVRDDEEVELGPTQEPMSAPLLPGRILLVEDNELNQQVVLGILEGIGRTATVVENGRDAVKRLTSESFDVVLMDCQMPLMDGYEATRLIRQQERFARSASEQPDSRPRRVPIVAMTASAMAGDREKCLRCGMDDYLSKPFARDQLLRVINKWLKITTIPSAVSPPSKPLAQPEESTSDSKSDAPRSTSPIDASAIETLQTLESNGSPGLVARVIETYLRTSPEMIESMRQALDSDDAEAIERSAHSLKSSSATLGALELAELCKELEQIGREAETTRAAAVFASLETEFDRVRRALSEQWQLTA
ncbi:MAG: two-component regulator propeller domain-containing protein [Thermoanaerobaculia bacterium]